MQAAAPAARLRGSQTAAVCVREVQALRDWAAKLVRSPWLAGSNQQARFRSGRSASMGCSARTGSGRTGSDRVGGGGLQKNMLTRLAMSSRCAIKPIKIFGRRVGVKAIESVSVVPL